MKKSAKRRVWLFLLACMLLLSACVNQHPEKEKTEEPISAGDENPNYSAAVNAAKAKVAQKDGEPRIVATSPAVADICDRLNLDLVGIAKSNIHKLPARYENVTQVGLAMNPDVEILSTLKPDWILSPVSLMGDLQPKYEAVGADYAFLNLNSVEGMYQSIEELGCIFGREAEAKALLDDFHEFYDAYTQKNHAKQKPKVLVLMGLPGSYLIATEHSYIGNLVKLAGGENVYYDDEKQFLNVNTEDMKTKEPDIILRAAHALPDNVRKMFDREFQENAIWKHFTAVQNHKVYDLSYETFGMSAKFNYKEALEELAPLLYPNESEK